MCRYRARITSPYAYNLTFPRLYRRQLQAPTGNANSTTGNWPGLCGEPKDLFTAVPGPAARLSTFQLSRLNPPSLAREPYRYHTFGNCGHLALHGSFMLWAIFFGHSAVSSSSQSMSWPVAQNGLRSVRTRGGSITKMAPGETRRGPIARRLSGASLSAGQKGEESRARRDYYSASRARPCARSNHPRRNSRWYSGLGLNDPSLSSYGECPGQGLQSRGSSTVAH